MDDELKASVELEVRRLVAQDINEQVAAYRSHLESQFNLLKQSIGIIAALAAVLLAFFLGRSWWELEDTITGKVNAVFAQHAVETRLADKALSTIESMPVMEKIDLAIADSVANRGLKALEPIIEQKRQELSKVNAGTLFAEVPVGTIIASALTQTQMETVGAGRWVLADGKSYPETEYATLTKKQNVPDLRGLFLRGINAGRKDTSADPSGERRVGDFQESGLQAHAHSVGTSGADSFSMAPGGATQRLAHFQNDQYGGGGPKMTGPFGGPETRPANAAVFYYIKIR